MNALKSPRTDPLKPPSVAPADLKNPLKALRVLLLWTSDSVITSLASTSKSVLESIATVYKDNVYWSDRLRKFYPQTWLNDSNIDYMLLYMVVANAHYGTRTGTAKDIAVALDKLSACYSEQDIIVLYPYLRRKLIPLPPLDYSPNDWINAYPAAFVKLNRRFIHNQILDTYYKGNAKIEWLSEKVLRSLYELYDVRFFGGVIKSLLKKKNATLTFVVSSKLTRVAGKCRRQGCSYTIKMSDTVVRKTFLGTAKYHVNGGLECTDRLECLQITFEHELMHLVMHLLPKGIIKGDTIYKGHGTFFKQLVKAYYGHTETTHQLFIEQDKKKTRDDFIGVEYATVTTPLRWGSELSKTVLTDPQTKEMWIARINKLNPVKAKVTRVSDCKEFTVSYSIMQPYHKPKPQTFAGTLPPVPFKLAKTPFKLIIPHHYIPLEGETVKVVPSDGTSWLGVVKKTNPKKAVVYRACDATAIASSDDGKIYNVPYEIIQATNEVVSVTIPKVTRVGVGQKVHVTDRRGDWTGLVTKTNPERAKVKRNSGDGLVYNVPYALLKTL